MSKFTRPTELPTIAFGPRMPGWGSWEWIGDDLSAVFRQWFSVQIFEPGEVPQADVVILVKHWPGRDWIEQVTRTSALVYCPVDGYGAVAEIDADGPSLRRCSRVVVHSERLRRYVEPYTRVEYLDHHIQFVGDHLAEYRTDGPILWVGARSNLPALIEWVNAHPLSVPLLALTNPEVPGVMPSPEAWGFRKDGDIRVEEWTRERHQARLLQCRAALDIKGLDFRARHKPPAKALDFLAAGVPLAMNPDSSSAEHLARMGFDLAVPWDTDRWWSREYHAETARFGLALRELLSQERIARRLKRMVDSVWEERRRR